MALCSATEVSAAIKALPSRNELAVHSRRAVAVIECAETVLKLCELEQFQLSLQVFQQNFSLLLTPQLKGGTALLVRGKRCGKSTLF